MKADSLSGAEKPRVLFIGRTRYRLPLKGGLARKWDALAAELDLCVLASSADGPNRDGRFVLIPPARLPKLEGALWWLLLPLRIARLVRSFRPDVIVTQSQYQAAAALVARGLAASHTPIVTEVHGDWRSATRLYGSPGRRLLSPLADAVARAALRRVDAVRATSPYTRRLVREFGVRPAATFPAYIDLRSFTEHEPVEPPQRPVGLFVGVLELYKNVDGLADAWRRVSVQLPEARLHVVGKGTLESVVYSLLRDCPESVRWTRELDAGGVARALDEATLLVLPSRSEGMGRVVIEAFCRARPVVGTRIGGIPDLVRDGSSGILVDPSDTTALADALVRLLGDRDLSRRYGLSAREQVQPLLQTPEDFAARMRSLVDELRET